MRNLILVVCILKLGLSHAQEVQQTKPPFSSATASVKNPSSQINFSGFYRFLGYVRNQQETFPNNTGKTTAIVVGDFYREPMFLLKLNGKTKENISFGADFMINSLYKGPSDEFTRPLTLDLGLNLKTSIHTKHGVFNFKSGGVSWYRQSRLTVWGNRSFNRMSIFERRPQTPLNKFPANRYSKYYKNGLIDEGVRYGSRAFQGIFVEGIKLPLNFSVKGVIGKSNFNRSSIPSSDNFTGCFAVKNQLNTSSKIGYNYLESKASVDSLNTDKRNYFIHTLEAYKAIGHFQFDVEIGLGKYSSPEYQLPIGEAFILNVKTKKTTKIPLNIQLYRISPQFVNVTGNFLNTTVLEVFPNLPGIGSTVRTPYQSPMVGIGFPVNNRQGGSVNAEATFGKLKLNGGLGIYAELDTSHAGIAYIHNVNNQTLSRIYLFGQNWGPYNSLNSTYRGIFENAILTDTNSTGLANFKKFYNTLELQAKYNNLVFGKNYYLFSLTRLNSCQNKVNAIPQIGTQALISQLSQEIDFSIEISKKTVFVLSYGIEKIIGNQQTELGVATQPSATNSFFEKLGWDKFYRYTKYRNQKNTLFGYGIDYKIEGNTFLFFRQSRYTYYDPNFIENHLKGWETTLELKIMF